MDSVPSRPIDRRGARGHDLWPVSKAVWRAMFGIFGPHFPLFRNKWDLQRAANYIGGRDLVAEMAAIDLAEHGAAA
jgi:hypothetical protein